MSGLEERLIEQARLARELAHAPYSGFKVGAAVAVGSDEEIFTGCNVENASYGATVCAERVAVCSAVAGGEKELVALAVVTPGKEPSPPCGMCLQVLAEFARDLPVYLAAADSKKVVRTSLEALLPTAFRL